jgi:GTP-binding protein HflX
VTHHQPDPAPGAEPERGFLVAVLAQGVDEQDELAEMRELLRTAGVEPVGELLQRRPAPDPRTYVGKGKLVELKQAVAGSDAESLVVDDDLDPGQQRRLEDELKLRVVDRTQLILDIFAQHATSAEGKLQVELAQLEYNLARMRVASASSDAGSRSSSAAAIPSARHAVAGRRRSSRSRGTRTPASPRF